MLKSVANKTLYSKDGLKNRPKKIVADLCATLKVWKNFGDYLSFTGGNKFGRSSGRWKDAFISVYCFFRRVACFGIDSEKDWKAQKTKQSVLN